MVQSILPTLQTNKLVVRQKVFYANIIEPSKFLLPRIPNFLSSRCWPANTQKFVPGRNFNYEEASNLGLKSDCSSKARYQTRANSLGKKRRALFFKRGLKFMKTGVARGVVPQTRANFFLAPQHFRTSRSLALAA